MNKKTKILMLISTVFLIALITITTYAWFESSFDPIIYSDTMYITSTDGLIIQLTDDNNTSTNEVNIKDVVRDYSYFFELPQVSSSDGENFFKRKVAESGSGYEYYKAEANKDYIEVTFMLNEDPTVHGTSDSSPNRTLYIESFDLYLIDNDGQEVADGRNQAIDAIRTSLKFQEINDDGTILAEKMAIIERDNKASGTNPARYDTKTSGNGDDSGTISEFGVNGFKLSDCIKGTGIADSTLVGTQNVEFASNYIYDECDLNFKTFATIKKDSGIKVVLRIWLEGADPSCGLDISGLKLFYNLKFGSYYYIHNFYDNRTSKTLVQKPIIINGYPDCTYNGVIKSIHSGTWYSNDGSIITTLKDKQSWDYYQTNAN